MHMQSNIINNPSDHTQRRRAWLVVIIFVALIYSTLGIIRPVCEFLREQGILVATINILLGISFFVFIGIILLLRLKKVIVKKQTFFILMLVLVVYLFIVGLVRFPEEKVHFIEYSFLAFLIYRALRVDLSGFFLYFVGFLLVFLIGWCDEIIQYFLPNRVYDIRDVFMNGIAGFFGFIFIFLITKDSRKT